MRKAYRPVERARSVFDATRRFRYSRFPVIDFRDRLAVASVAAGVRPIGVLDCDGLQISEIRDVLINHGLRTLRTASVWTMMERSDQHPNIKYLRFLDRQRKDQLREACYGSLPPRKIEQRLRDGSCPNRNPGCY